MTIYGYARTEPGPDADSELARQCRELSAAGCVRVFADTCSPHPNCGPDLARALGALRPGDWLVVIEPVVITGSSPQWALIVDVIRERGGSIRAAGTETTNDDDARHAFTSLIAVEQRNQDRRNPAASLAEERALLAAWRQTITSAVPDIDARVADLERRRSEAEAVIRQLMAEESGLPPSVIAALMKGFAGFDTKIEKLRRRTA